MRVFAILLLFISVEAEVFSSVEHVLTTGSSVKHFRRPPSSRVGSSRADHHNSLLSISTAKTWNSSDIVDSELFVNCAATNGSSPATSNLNPPTFEDYWCRNLMQPYVYGDPRPLFYGFNDSIKRTCLSINKASFSSWVNEFDHTQDWWPTQQPPCCDLHCYLSLGSAQVLYWPTPAPTPGITTMVGLDGFTL